MKHELSPIVLELAARYRWVPSSESGTERLVIGDLEHGFVLEDQASDFAFYSRVDRGREILELITPSWEVLEKYALFYVGAVSRLKLGFAESVTNSKYPSDLPDGMSVSGDETGSRLYGPDGKEIAFLPKRGVRHAVHLGGYVQSSLDEIAYSLNQKDGRPLFMTTSEWRRREEARER